MTNVASAIMVDPMYHRFWRGFAILSQLMVLSSACAADLSAVHENYYEDFLALFPFDAASNGDSDHRYEHVWPSDISVEHRAQEAALVQK